MLPDGRGSDNRSKLNGSGISNKGFHQWGVQCILGNIRETPMWELKAWLNIGDADGATIKRN